MERKIACAYCDDVLSTKDGVETAKLISTGEIKEIEVIEAAIARAKKVNHSINAIVNDSFDSVLNHINERGDAPFRGVPSFIKDTDDVKGVPTLFGSRAVTKNQAKKSSNFVKLYKTLGFRCLGKSTLPELGLTCTTEPLSTGPTRNPLNLEHSTGGSSGGAAALVASGVVPVAHGTDGGGSIRVPAACCGLVGLKPTIGRLPLRDRSDKLPINIISDGILSRTVRDTAFFYAEAEKYYMNPDLPKLGLIKHPSKKRLRIGMVNSAPNSKSLNPNVYDQIRKVGEVCKELGHEVEEIKFPFPKNVMDDFFIYWASLAFYFHYFGKKITGNPINKGKLEKFTLGLSSFYRKNILKTPFVIKRLKKFKYCYESFFNQYDLILSPTTADAAPKLGYLSTELDFKLAFDRLYNFVPFTAYQNISGAPAISLPLGYDKDDMPIGIQFAAAFGMDKTLIDVAFELEEAIPWPRANNWKDITMA